MSLEKSEIKMSAKQIVKLFKNGKINFEHIVQRGYVWERARQSAFIESMLLGYPLGIIYSKRIPDKNGKSNNIHYIMDGKQRLTTIIRYLNSEFALSELPEITYIDESTMEEVQANISGLKFKDLPEQLQDNLQTMNINFLYFDTLTPNEEKELFKRLNAGKPLTAKNLALANCKDLDAMLSIGEHLLFQEVLTEKQLGNKLQVTLIAKANAMLFDDLENISFESRVLNKMLEKTITDEQKIKLNEVFNMFRQIRNNLLNNNDTVLLKKVFKEIHFISLVPFINKGIEDGIGDEMLSNWIKDFFIENKEYDKACLSGVAKTSMIKARHICLEKSFNEYFKVDDIEIINTNDVNEQIETTGEETGEDNIFSDADSIVEEMIETEDIRNLW